MEIKDSSQETVPALAANQRYCHGCAKPIHITAAACPFCGAGQHAVAAMPAQGAPGQGRVTADQKYCDKCGTVMHQSAASCPSCGAEQVGAGGKKRTVAAVLAIFLGGFGVHHFYLGNIILGLVYLFFCWTFIPAFIAFIEGIVYLVKSDAEFARKYPGK